MGISKPIDDVIFDFKHIIRGEIIGEAFVDNSNIGDFTPERLLAYIYAVMYSRKYRDKYKEFINSSFPRIPYPQTKKQFDRLSLYGMKLMELHLLKNTDKELDDVDRDIVGQIVEKSTYKNNTVFISKNNGFIDVDESAWTFVMCGYQPLQKWLKDRKGTILTSASVMHFRSMVKTILATQEIMNEIDTLLSV